MGIQPDRVRKQRTFREGHPRKESSKRTSCCIAMGLSCRYLPCPRITEACPQEMAHCRRQRRRRRWLSSSGWRNPTSQVVRLHSRWRLRAIPGVEKVFVFNINVNLVLFHGTATLMLLRRKRFPVFFFALFLLCTNTVCISWRVLMQRDQDTRNAINGKYTGFLFSLPVAVSVITPNGKFAGSWWLIRRKQH